MTTRPREINVYAPAIADRPVVPTGRHVAPPGPLPRNLAQTVPTPFPFYLLAYLHSPQAWFATAFFGGLTALEFVFVSPSLHPVLAAMVTVTALLVTAIIVMVVTVRTACENAVVIYKDGERTEVDAEWKMWRQRGRKWTDAWRWPVEDKHGIPHKRILIIDAQAYDFGHPEILYRDVATTNPPAAVPVEGKPVVIREPLLRPLLPFMAPLPVRPAGLDSSIPFHAPSMAELGMAEAVGLAARGWMNTKSPTAELMSIALLGLMIGGAFVLIFMGGSQVTETLSTVQKAASNDAVNAAVQAEIQRRFAEEGFLLVQYTPVPVLQPATPTPAP